MKSKPMYMLKHKTDGLVCMIAPSAAILRDQAEIKYRSDWPTLRDVGGYWVVKVIVQEVEND